MDPALTLAGTAGICFVGGLLPWANAEAAVVGAALLLPPPALPFLVLGSAAGHASAKCAVYGLARWAPRGLPRRARARLERLPTLAGRSHSLGATVLASSTFGFPPLYVVTLACGTVGVPFAAFLPAALAGMVIRYAALAVATVLLKGGL